MRSGEPPGRPSASNGPSSARGSTRRPRGDATARPAGDAGFCWLPGVGTTRWSRSTGPLATKRRRIWGFVAVCFVVLQALTWIVTPSWGMRAAVLIVSIFALPVAAALSSP